MLKRIKERLDGVVNPIMVREMYQSVHSRAMMAFFWLLLAVALLIYHLSARSGLETPGEGMFVGFAILIGVMSLFLIPCAVFFTLYREVTSKTIELVQITGMSAGQLVRGRLLAAAARIVLLYSLIAPFAVASFLFGGVDPVWVLVTVYYLLVVSFGACAVALFFGSLAVYRRIRVLAMGAFVGLMIFSLIGGLTASGGAYVALSLGGVPGPTTGPLLASLAWTTVLGILGIMFLTAASANSLTFPHNRCSAGTKLIALLLVGALYGSWLTAGLASGGGFGFEPSGFALPACSLIGVCSLAWITAQPHVPYRHRVRLRKYGRLGRLLYFPFRDGAGSTAAYLGIAMVLVALGAFSLTRMGRTAMWPVGSIETSYAFYAVALALTYVLYFSALAGGITRLFPLRLRTAGVRRTVLLALLVLNALVVLVPPVFTDFDLRDLNSIPVAFLPMLYIASLHRRLGLPTFLVHMAGPFLIGLVYHVLHGVGESVELAAAMKSDAPPDARIGAEGAEGG